MKKLIIAEKPSLARNIAEGIKLIGETPKMQNGYLESSSYIITWCFGHLLELINLEEYRADYDVNEKYSWTLEGLPFYPEPFKYELKRGKDKKTDAGVKTQYNIIKGLVARVDVQAIVNAGDADREGEIIIRNVLTKMGNKKTVYRLWMPDQTPQTIKNKLTHMELDNHYDNMAAEGLARTYIDWMYGINLTRYATCKAKAYPPLKVGRVVTAIIRAIYERDKLIENFVPEKYWVNRSAEVTNGEVIELVGSQKYAPSEKSVALQNATLYNAAGAKVIDVKQEEKVIAPGKLFSLSKLQGALSTRYKMAPKKSLQIIQELYEKGYLSYPRTNTEYLAEEEKGKVNAIIGILAKAGYQVTFKDKKSIFDSSKIESHSALTPTFKIPDIAKLSEDEKKVYQTVLNRFLAVFATEECRVNRTTIVIAVGQYEQFKLKGDVLLQKGWMQYEASDKKDKILPALKVGDNVNINFKPTEKETTPPKHYTVITLNEYLLNPFKEEKKNAAQTDDAEDYKSIFEGLELGTEATRTDIINGAILNGFISLKNNNYYIEVRGKYLIETLEQLGIKMDKYDTVKLSKALKKVYRKEITIAQAMEIAKEEINSIFANQDNITLTTQAPSDKVSVGKCPVCGADVIKGKPKEGKQGYYCSNKTCRFIIGQAYKKNLTEAQVKKLLEGKKVLLKGLKSAKGTYDMYLTKKGIKTLPGENPCMVMEYQTEFPKNPKNDTKRSK